MLICPNCGEALKRREKSYVCKQGHTFDIAKEGYANLLVHTQKATGDDKEMVKARRDFFKKDYYHHLQTEVINLVKKYQPQVIVDAGCGEGYYTNALKAAYPTGTIYAFDLAKYAIASASKGRKDVRYFVANLFYLPLSAASVDLVYSIFAPIAPQENYRILKERGIFIKVGPAAQHLYEMKAIIYAKPYLNPLKYLHDEHFKKAEELTIKRQIRLKSKEEIKALLTMTPYYHTSPQEGSKRLLALDELTVTTAFQIEVYQKL